MLGPGAWTVLFSTEGRRLLSGDEALSEVGVKAPSEALVGLGSRRASAQRGEPDREQLAGLRRQGGFDAARTFAVGALHAPRCHGAGGSLRLGVNGARSLSINSQPKENQQ